MRDSPQLRILVVEDDTRMLDLLCRGLREAGHTVMPVSEGQAALELATSFDFDIVLLDIGLPNRNGYEITRELRARNSIVPILMLTARDAEDDMILGFDCGADDYLVKPFSFPELIARLNALARSTPGRGSGPRLVLDPARLTVMRNNRPLRLTRTEFLLLLALMQHGGEPVPRQSLIDAVWGIEHPVHSNTLDVFINSLRGKVEAAFRSRFILTVRGIGYRLRVDNISPPSEYEELAR